MNDDKDIKYPDNVIDKGKYVEYINLKNELENHPEKKYKTSTNDIIDLAATLYIINKQIPNLPVEEQNLIREKASKIRSLIAKLARLKKDAFGEFKNSMDGMGLPQLKERHSEILDLFARMFKVSEVHKIIYTDWHYKNISLDQLREFYRRNAQKIEELRKEYIENYSDVRLSHRRSRLHEYSWLYDKIKNKYIKFEARHDAKMMQTLLESIKKEVDGDLVINGKFQVDVEHTINIHVQQEMLKELNISALIISRVAGRLNINPIFLLSRLTNSYYAKFTGFAANTREGMNNDEIYSPTGIVYNWEEITQKQVELVKEQEKLKNVGNIEQAEVIEIIENKKENIKPTLTIKDLLQKRVEEQQQSFKQSQEKTNQYNQPDRI